MRWTLKNCSETSQRVVKMISFSFVLWILYFVISLVSFFYLRNAYFPQFPTKFESFISLIMAFCWIVSVPVTWILKQNEGDDQISFDTSYDGFVGREQ